VSHADGLASSAFAHHYSRNHFCFLFLRVLRCFTSPRTLRRPMHSNDGDSPQRLPGYPIRTPSDHSSVDSSPRPIAASHVLHRSLMPRHPPCAHTHLTTPHHHTPHTPTPPSSQLSHPAKHTRQPTDHQEKHQHTRNAAAEAATTHTILIKPVSNQYGTRHTLL